MSHELRTPLSMIMGFSALLGEGAVGAVNQQQSEYLDRIQTNGRHLHQLVEDMLFFVDAESAPITPTWSDVELRPLVDSIVSAMLKIAEGGGPAFVLAIPPAAATLRTDATLLRRVLFHLLGNAFKFTDQGEVRLEAERDQGTHDTIIRIADTGSGIPPERSHRIFELFREADDSYTRKHDGAGLGLNLVRACLGLLHGRCHIGPGSKGGTRVELRMPEASDAAAATPRPAAPSVESAPPFRATATRG